MCITIVRLQKKEFVCEVKDGNRSIFGLLGNILRLNVFILQNLCNTSTSETIHHVKIIIVEENIIGFVLFATRKLHETRAEGRIVWSADYDLFAILFAFFIQASRTTAVVISGLIIKNRH